MSMIPDLRGLLNQLRQDTWGRGTLPQPMQLLAISHGPGVSAVRDINGSCEHLLKRIGATLMNGQGESQQDQDDGWNRRRTLRMAIEEQTRRVSKLRARKTIEVVGKMQNLPNFLGEHAAARPHIAHAIPR